MKMRVYNDNTHPYKEHFKGDDIAIPSKGFILMDYDDAHQFKGTFSYPVLDADGNHTPAGFKMIRLEQDTEEPAITNVTYQCNACKYKGANEADLSEHSKATHAGEVIVDEAAEEEIRTKRKYTKRAG